MAKQLSFLRDVDGVQTKEKVLEYFSDYRMHILSVPDDLMPKVTQTFSLTPSSDTNTFHSSTESIAIKRIDEERERNDFINRTIRAVNRLSARERELITKTYMTYEDVYDYDVYNEMGVSETTFYRIRERAFYKLAHNLNLAVYKDNKEVPAI